MGHRHERFPGPLREQLLRVMCPARTTTEEIAGLHSDVGRFYAEAARKAIDKLNGGRRPDLIGCHGQTICHLPGRAAGSSTLQIGEAAFIAAATGCPVVADFRQGDLAAGGQGAPLVPWTDLVLFGDRRIARAVQNIGGIANVTYLPIGAGPKDVVAFDTGPGNMVIDEVTRIATNNRRSFDTAGRIAARGRVLETVLARWLRNDYFARRPPKSAGREDFGRQFVAREMPRLRVASPRPEDWLATATAFTARSIADAYRRFLPRGTSCRPAPRSKLRTANSKFPPLIRGGRGEIPRIDEVIVAGGGAANATLLAMLSAELPGVPIRTMGHYGIGIQEKEAVSFAMLAAAHVDGVPANLPQVTGARRLAILGKLCQPPC
jgi:anhydro-N-acetylmuramic acid kinase